MFHFTSHSSADKLLGCFYFLAIGNKVDMLSVSKPVLWTPGTAQIGEGIENSWGHLEDSEKEDEDEGGSDEAIILDGMKMDTGVEVSNIGSQGM